jgi:hypothetical protein
MTITERLKAVPANIYVIVFLGIFAVAALFAYFLREDTILLERKIASRQKDVGMMLQLRDSYEAKRQTLSKHGQKEVEQRRLSLATIEEMAAKNLVGGKLTSLQPGTAEKHRGGQGMSIEVKIAGAPRGEVISFVKAAESNGLAIERLRLSLPEANPMALDLQATITDGQPHG